MKQIGFLAYVGQRMRFDAVVATLDEAHCILNVSILCTHIGMRLLDHLRKTKGGKIDQPTKTSGFSFPFTHAHLSLAGRYVQGPVNVMRKFQSMSRVKSVCAIAMQSTP